MRLTDEEIAAWTKLHHDLSKNTSNKITEEEWNAISTPSFALGKVVAYEGIGSMLRKMAGDCFSKSKDDEANIIRRLAEQFERLAKDDRADYDHNYPK